MIHLALEWFQTALWAATSIVLVCIIADSLSNVKHMRPFKLPLFRNLGTMVVRQVAQGRGSVAPLPFLHSSCGLAFPEQTVVDVFTSSET